MEEINYVKLLPTKPPEGTLEWLKPRSGLRTEYLIYRADWYTDPLTGMRQKGVRVTCTRCRCSVILQYIAADSCGRSYAPAPFGFYNPLTSEAVISGSDTLCPECGSQVRVHHVGNIPNGVTLEAWCMTVGRLDEKLVLFGWLFQRFIGKDGSSSYRSMPYEAYVVEQRKIVRLMGYQKCLSTVHLFGHWEQRKTYLDNWGYATRIAPWDPEILVGSTAEHSKLDLYLQIASEEQRVPVTWLKVWQKHKNAENLLMQGAGHLLQELIEKESRRYSYERAKGCPKLEEIDWKEKRPAQMLGLNKAEFSTCVRDGWKAEELSVYKTLRCLEPIALPEDMRLVRLYGTYGVQRLLGNNRGGLGVMRCLRYLEKQNRRGGNPSKVDPGYLLDYWRMAEACGRDLQDLSLRLPKDLRRAHDQVMTEEAEQKAAQDAERKAKEIARRAPAFRRRVEELAPYAWERDGLLIRAASCEEELIREGEMLSHCVAGYASQVASGSTAIFFIRKTEKPEKPYFTLQLDEKGLRVIQNRGRKNCERTAEVRDFEEKWLAWLREQDAAGKLRPKKETKPKKEDAA